MIIIADLELDASISEQHGFESEVTEHPVEEGADIADHVRARPIVVTIEGVVSDAPIGPVATRRTANALPSDDALAKLLAIRDAREPVTIQTTLGNKSPNEVGKVYQNMVLTSLSIPRDSATGFALRFSATFTQIQLVTNERTTVRVSVPRGAKKVNLGNKPSAPVAANAIPATVPQVNPFKPATRRIPISTDDGVTFTPAGKVAPTQNRDLARAFRSQF